MNPNATLGDAATIPRFLSRGRAFVYVIACRDDSLFKIGFCRDPIDRWRILQRRFFEFFDLDRGILIATDRVVHARRLERFLLNAFADYRAFAPLVVPSSAAGHTEWFRGVLDEVGDAAQRAATNDGLAYHRPPSRWLRSALLARQDVLFAWTAHTLEVIEFERNNAADFTLCVIYENALGDALDALQAVNLDFSAWVPAQVLQWHISRTTPVRRTTPD